MCVGASATEGRVEWEKREADGRETAVSLASDSRADLLQHRTRFPVSAQGVIRRAN